jgi:hypothetical protein
MQYGERGFHSGTEKPSKRLFEIVEPVGGEAKNDHVEFVSFGDLMNDKRPTLLYLCLYTLPNYGVCINVV